MPAALRLHRRSAVDLLRVAIAALPDEECDGSEEARGDASAGRSVAVMEGPFGATAAGSGRECQGSENSATRTQRARDAQQVHRGAAVEAERGGHACTQPSDGQSRQIRST